MSQKQSKKYRKEVRRTVDKNLGIGFDALSNIVRSRPQWIPKKIWLILYLPLFPRKYMYLLNKYIK